MSSESKAANGHRAHDLDGIRRDIAHLRDDVAGMTREVGKDVTDDLSARGGRAASAIRRQFDAKPLWGLLLACAAGFVGSRLLSR